MPPSSPAPDAREVDRIEALATVTDPAMVDAFLDRCVPGSIWVVRIRTAEVAAQLIARQRLESFDERVCTCLTLQLDLPVPVEPGLRFRFTADDNDRVVGTGVGRPWDE